MRRRRRGISGRGTWGARSNGGGCGWRRDGWVWAQAANGAKSGSDIEMGNTGSVGVVSRRAAKKAKLTK